MGIHDLGLQFYFVRLYTRFTCTWTLQEGDDIRGSHFSPRKETGTNKPYEWQSYIKINARICNFLLNGYTNSLPFSFLLSLSLPPPLLINRTAEMQYLSSREKSCRLNVVKQMSCRRSTYARSFPSQGMVFPILPVGLNAPSLKDVRCTSREASAREGGCGDTPPISCRSFLKW